MAVTLLECIRNLYKSLYEPRLPGAPLQWPKVMVNLPSNVSAKILDEIGVCAFFPLSQDW